MFSFTITEASRNHFKLTNTVCYFFVMWLFVTVLLSGVNKKRAVWLEKEMYVLGLLDIAAV